MAIRNPDNTVKSLKRGRPISKNSQDFISAQEPLDLRDKQLNLKLTARQRTEIVESFDVARVKGFTGTLGDYVQEAITSMNDRAPTTVIQSADAETLDIVRSELDQGSRQMRSLQETVAKVSGSLTVHATRSNSRIEALASLVREQTDSMQHLLKQAVDLLILVSQAQSGLDSSPPPASSTRAAAAPMPASSTSARLAGEPSRVTSSKSSGLRRPLGSS